MRSSPLFFRGERRAKVISRKSNTRRNYLSDSSNKNPAPARVSSRAFGKRAMHLRERTCAPGLSSSVRMENSHRASIVSLREHPATFSERTPSRRKRLLHLAADDFP